MAYGPPAKKQKTQNNEAAELSRSNGSDVVFYRSFVCVARMAVLPLGDEQIVSGEQIVWCANGTNKFFDEQIVWYLSVWRDDFSQTICPSRWTSRRQYDIRELTKDDADGNDDATKQ